jgi:hypothetical protein
MPMVFQECSPTHSLISAGARTRRATTRSVFLAICCCALTGSVCQSGQIDFDRDIRPLLASKCFHCHGPDAAHREADLRLDLRDAAFEDRGGYAAVTAGKPESSELYRRIMSADDDERMPPPESRLALTAAERERIRLWIQEGAAWQQHWSFVPPVRPPLPETSDTGWVRNPIDAFVLARLEAARLAPAPAADKTTLIRRVTLDLTGLPPTPDEVSAFLNDSSPQAWDSVVDRLLQSPAYGQRMAWEWLDAARFADTDGFQGDPTRSMWPWRDWLVNALNDNMPFDQFTTEMLAGDLLPNASEDQILATGFNRNHMYNGEGGRIAEETRVENVFDRTETTSTVWLGLTMTCCRCHDHKFDPVTQAEYYQLFALFNNTSETGRGNTRGAAPPSRRYLSPTQRTRIADIDRHLDQLSVQLAAPDPDTDAAQLKWETELKQRLSAASEATSPTAYSDWYQTGPVPQATAAPSPAALAALLQPAAAAARPQPLYANLAWQKQPGYRDGEVHDLPDTIGSTYLFRTIDASTARSLDLSLGSDDNITIWVNGATPVFDKKVPRAAAPDQDRVTINLKPGRNQLLLRIQNTGGIAGFYFRVAGESAAGVPSEVAEIAVKSPEQRTAEDRLVLQQHYRSNHWPQWQQLKQEQEQLQQEREAITSSAPTVMVMDQLPKEKRRDTRVLERGIYNKPTDIVVRPGTPEALHRFEGGTVQNRLDLARWLMASDNPLTARVTVNRYWQQFFGRGLVSTTEDFGQTGARPSHPELLDWLAVEFRDSGWNVKHLHRLIVTSATYRQSSYRNDAKSAAAVIEQVDPANTLYWHAPRYRLPSWMLRDQALAVAGLLNPAAGGPSVRPYQPAGIWAEATFGKIRYQQDSGNALYRRSLYVFWRRIVGPPIFFDAAKRQTCEVKPTRTNTPLHALTTLNETAWVEAARAMAERVLLSDAGTDADRVTRAFQLALARSADPEEAEILLRRLPQLQAHYTDSPDMAAALLSVGASPRNETLPIAQHAAWTVICSTILNLDQFLTRE